MSEEYKNGIISTLKTLFPKENFSIDNTVLVVGCGVSIDSGLPDGVTFTKTVLKSYNLDAKLPEWIESINKEYIKSITGNVAVELYSFPRLESVLNTLQNSLTEDQYNSFLIGTLYGDKEVKSNLYHRLIAEYLHDGGSVLTFNFDKLVEEAYQELYCGEQMNNINIFPMGSGSISRSKGLFIKAHGCLSQPSKIGMTLNKLFIGGFPDSSSEGKTLDAMFHSRIRHVVSIGYSYSDSIDFTPYLKKKGKDFNYIHFQYELNNSGAFRIDSLRNVEPKNTYKYVLDSILESGDGNANVVFFNKQCFINKFGSWWTGTIDVNPKINFSPLPVKGPEYSLSLLNLIYEYGLSEYKTFREDQRWMKEIDLHRKRVFHFRRIPYMKRLSIFSSYLNRDIHNYFSHFLLFFCNIFSFKRTLLRRIAVFQGTIVELIFTANKRRSLIAESGPESNAIHALKTCRNLILGIPLLVLTEILLCMGLGIGRLIGFDCWCAVHNPPLDDYLIAYRRHYQPFYVLAEKLRYNAGLFIPRWIVKILRRRVNKCLELACDLKNMNEYRYIRKEDMILKMLPKGNKDNEDIINGYNELILFDADTNYFIEVRNVSRKKELTINLLKDEKKNHC